MSPKSKSIRLPLGLLLGVLATVAILGVSPVAAAVTPIYATHHWVSSQKDETRLLEGSEMMPAYLNGSVVNTEYEQGFYVGNFTTHNNTFGAEPMDGGASAGVKPNSYPTDANHFDPLWVLVPWWGPASAPYAPAYDPASYGVKLQCAPATIAVCYDHPATIGVPGLGVVPLPGHDHLINTAAGHFDEWWNVIVVLVLNPTVFPTLNGAHGITSVQDLRLAQYHGTASHDIPTNFFLDFSVIAPGHMDGRKSVAPPTYRLNASVMMPTFFGGAVYNSYYEQGYFVGNVTPHNSTFGGEPLLGLPAAGVGPSRLPASASNIADLYVLVPWWGPSATPYAPAYNPAAYGIREQCAPASISICWDHPATINVPGLGIVPLPGHDHLVGTLAGHVDIWWNVVVVLVLDPSVWPNLAGTHGITSTALLHDAEGDGLTSSEIPTNVFLNFAMGTPSMP
jgi:hypothetical protein